MKKNKIFLKNDKVGDCYWERPEGSLFDSYYTKV